MMLVKSRMCDGEIYTTNQCGELVIVKYVNNNIVHVKFLDTGYETITTLLFSLVIFVYHENVQ